jgi:hypothetical protein
LRRSPLPERAVGVAPLVGAAPVSVDLVLELAAGAAPVAVDLVLECAAGAAPVAADLTWC